MEKNNPETSKKWKRKKYLASPKYCAICGAVLPNGCQTYCLDCLLKGFKYTEGEERKVAAHRLRNRGFTPPEIWREIEKRGI